MAWCCLLAVLQPSSLLLGLWAAFSLWHQGHRSVISPLNAELGLKAPREQGLVCSWTLLPTRDGMGWDGMVRSLCQRWPTLCRRDRESGRKNLLWSQNRPCTVLILNVNAARGKRACCLLSLYPWGNQATM